MSVVIVAYCENVSRIVCRCLCDINGCRGRRLNSTPRLGIGSFHGPAMWKFQFEKNTIQQGQKRSYVPWVFSRWYKFKNVGEEATSNGAGGDQMGRLYLLLVVRWRYFYFFFFFRFKISRRLETCTLCWKEVRSSPPSSQIRMGTYLPKYLAEVPGPSYGACHTSKPCPYPKSRILGISSKACGSSIHDTSAMLHY